MSFMNINVTLKSQELANASKLKGKRMKNAEARVLNCENVLIWMFVTKNGRIGPNAQAEFYESLILKQFSL